MPITSKQRAQLRGLAMSEDTIVQVGKGGITDNLIASVDAALQARDSPREVLDQLCERLSAEPIQVIGTKFVIFRRNHADPKIELVKSKKK